MMHDLFSRTDVNTVIEVTENFLIQLKKFKEKYPHAHLNPNYVHLLNQIFQSPDVMFYHKR